MEIVREWSPLGADHFLELVRAAYYTDVAFYRMVPNFVAQFGINPDPAVRQRHSEPIADDPHHGVPFAKGTICYAGSGVNSRTTEVFFSYEANQGLAKDPFGTPFGRIAPNSLEVFEQLYNGYGDMPPWGTGPDPARIKAEGNDYLRQNFPELDYLQSCGVVGEPMPVPAPPPPPAVEELISKPLRGLSLETAFLAVTAIVVSLLGISFLCNTCCCGSPTPPPQYQGVYGGQQMMPPGQQMQMQPFLR